MLKNLSMHLKKYVMKLVCFSFAVINAAIITQNLVVFS